MIKITKNKKGISLVEVLVYIFVFSLAISAFVSFFLMLRSVEVKGRIMADLENDSVFISELLHKEILNSESIIFPVEGQAGASLNVLKRDGSGEISFFIQGEKLRLRSAGEDFILNSPGIYTGNLNFERSLDNPDSLKISFTFFSKGSSREFVYEKDYQFSLNLRQ